MTPACALHTRGCACGEESPATWRSSAIAANAVAASSRGGTGDTREGAAAAAEDIDEGATPAADSTAASTVSTTAASSTAAAAEEEEDDEEEDEETTRACFAVGSPVAPCSARDLFALLTPAATLPMMACCEERHDAHSASPESNGTVAGTPLQRAQESRCEGDLRDLAELAGTAAPPTGLKIQWEYQEWGALLRWTRSSEI
jgi:hypothetical protein